MDKKKMRTHKAHEVGPARRDLAREGPHSGSDLHSRLGLGEVQGKEGLSTETMEEGINKVFESGATIGENGFKKLLKVLGRGAEFDDTEVDWIFEMVDKDHSGKVGRSQLDEVKCALAKYLLAREEVQEQYAKNDNDRSSVLSRRGMRTMLTDLNNGIPCTDDEMQMVIKHASKFRKVRPFPFHDTPPSEFQEAINFWYTNVHPPVHEDLSKKQDPQKGGVVGRAFTAMIDKPPTQAQHPYQHRVLDHKPYHQKHLQPWNAR